MGRFKNGNLILEGDRDVVSDGGTPLYPIGENAVINGDMMIAQRGTDIDVSSGATYGLDRWKVYSTVEATFAMQQSTNVPTFAQSGYKSLYSLLINPSSTDTPLDPADYALLTHIIEGYRIAPFVGHTVTLSFWLYSTKTGVTCCKIINYGAGLEILKEFTVSQSNTWEKHTWTFDLDATQTWELEENGGLGLNFSLGAGSNFQGAATETWSDFAYQATSNQVNHFDSASNVYRLSQVQLELGDAATTFKGRDMATELALCQRYYEKSYELNVAPGTATSPGSMNYYNGTSGNTFFTIYFKVRKRIAPTIQTYALDGTSGAITMDSVTTLTGGGLAASESTLRERTSAGTGAENDVQVHWTADADI